MNVRRIFGSVWRAVSSAPDPALLQCRSRLEQLLTHKRRMFLHSLMLIDHLPYNIDPLTGDIISSRRSVSDVVERAQQKFGPNQNLVNELIKKLGNDPPELMRMIDRLEIVFSMMETRGFNPRRLIPGLYIWLTDGTFSPVAKDIYQLNDLIDRLDKMMAEGIDPANALWSDAMRAKAQSAGRAVSLP